MTLSSSTLSRLSDRLHRPLPGHDAHLHMSPRTPRRREALSVEGKSCRKAGVLVLLLPHEDTSAVVLTVRRDDLDDHAGQISFPGGKQEAGESLDETALREAHEEIGVSPASVRLLGSLTPLYVPPSNFCVHPFVGVGPSAPCLRPTDREVEDVLRAPLPLLLAPDTRTEERWTLYGEKVNIPYYDVDGHTVWGATAMILSELLAIVGEARPGSD